MLTKQCQFIRVCSTQAGMALNGNLYKFFNTGKGWVCSMCRWVDV